MSDYTTKVGTTEITIRANFAQAADDVWVRYSDCGDAAKFQSSGKQVADFQHRPKAALKYFADEVRNS